MNSEKDVIKKIELVAEHVKSIKNSSLNEVCKIGIIDMQNWEWAQGVGIYGMYRYYEYTKNIEQLDWITDWMKRHIENGLPEKNINTTAPLLTLTYLLDYLKDRKYFDLCVEWAQWLMNELPKTKYGGFQHVVSDGPNYMQIWDDTLFMAVLFLARMYVLTGNKDYLKECEYQFLLHIKYLQDKKTGLWYHGWTFDGNHNFADVFWGRGNCWITIAIPELLDMTEIDEGVRQYLINSLNAQVEALSELQDSSGLWHTVLDDKTSYLEVSATAGFAYGILKGIRMGILDEKYKSMALRACDAVIDNINKDGGVENVSYGTGMGMTVQDYKEIPICEMTYGSSLVIMLLVELLNNMKPNKSENFVIVSHKISTVSTEDT